MSFRIALLAEGPLDAGRLSTGHAPGQELGHEHLGPAHLLVRRVFVESGSLPAGAVRFVAPLRKGNSREARGSDLRERTTLRRLLSYPPGAERPDLVVVLVDADGERGRREMLLEHIEGISQTAAIGLCIQEFEAWLVADTRALTEAAGSPCDTVADPEGLAPRAAKSRLAELAATRPGLAPRDLRLSIAARLDLDVLARRCPAFERFRADLLSVSTARR